MLKAFHDRLQAATQESRRRIREKAVAVQKARSRLAASAATVRGVVDRLADFAGRQLPRQFRDGVIVPRDAALKEAEAAFKGVAETMGRREMKALQEKEARHLGFLRERGFRVKSVKSRR